MVKETANSPKKAGSTFSYSRFHFLLHDQFVMFAFRYLSLPGTMKLQQVYVETKFRQPNIQRGVLIKSCV